MMATTYESCSTQQELTVRRWLTEAQRTGRKDAGSGKRPHARFTWTANAIIQIDQAGQAPRSILASVRDISNTGLSLKCRAPIDRDTPVRIKMSAWGGAVNGIVRHCTRSVGVYMVGVEFLRKD